MSKKEFWNTFNSKKISESLAIFEKLTDDEKHTIFEEFFQSHALKEKPLLVSILRRNLRDNHSFQDFYKAWFPQPDMCQQTCVGNQIYQQSFPTPVRVLNGANIDNPREIFSIGLTWATNETQEKNIWNYIEKAKQGEDTNNEQRHDNIDQVADGSLLGLIKVKSDDNLGTPF